MNIKNQDKLFEDICSKYKIKFRNVDIHREYFGGDVEGGLYDNASAMVFGEIFLGIYDDLELRAISFFHELGHIDDIQNKCLGNWKTWDYYHFDEASAWKTGIRLAKEYDFEFSENTVECAKEALKSYFHPNPPNNEKTDMKYYKQAEKYAFEGKI